MKRHLFIALILTALVLGSGMSGCYTQLTVRESPVYYTETPEYSESYVDSAGTVVNNNYYYDYPRSRMYFSYYYPLRSSVMWGWYDPFWDWCYYPSYDYYYWNRWHSPWYSPWGWGYSPYYSHYHGHGWGGGYGGGWTNDNPRRDGGRYRDFGSTRTLDSRTRAYGVTRGTVSTGTGVTTPTSRSRTTDAYDRVSTRSRERNATTPTSGGSYNSSTDRSRSRSGDGATVNDGGNSRSRDASGPTGGGSSASPSGNSRSRESAAPSSDTRSRDRGSSSTPSYSPPPSSSPRSDGGGSRGGDGGGSRGGDSGGSRGGGGNSGGSSSGGGRSRSR